MTIEEDLKFERGLRDGRAEDALLDAVAEALDHTVTQRLAKLPAEYRDARKLIAMLRKQGYVIKPRGESARLYKRARELETGVAKLADKFFR